MLSRRWWESDDFKQFVPFLRAVWAKDVRQGRHARLELAGSTPWLVVQAALDFRGVCVGCSKEIRPFRRRSVTLPRGGGMVVGGVYLGVSCPQGSGCLGGSKGMAASQAYDAIEKLVADYAAAKKAVARQGSLL